MNNAENEGKKALIDLHSKLSDETERNYDFLWSNKNWKSHISSNIQTQEQSLLVDKGYDRQINVIFVTKKLIQHIYVSNKSFKLYNWI